MRKPKPIRERAARALCELQNLPADAKMDGAPTWQSNLPEVDAALQAAVCKDQIISLNDVEIVDNQDIFDFRVEQYAFLDG